MSKPGGLSVMRTAAGMTLLTLLVVGLAGCGSSSGSDPASTKPSGTYQSTGSEGKDLVPGSTVLLTFTDDALVVQAGCNSMRAGWEFTDGTVRWTGPAAGTRMACQPALMEQDQWFSDQLTTGMKVVDGSGDLSLSGGGATITFEHVPDPAPSAS